MGKRTALAVAALILTLSPRPGGAPAAADPQPEPSCAELACRMCRVMTDAAAKVIGDEPGYCAA